MNFSTIREGRDHRLHVMTRTAEWFLSRIQRDTAKGLIEGYRNHLSHTGSSRGYKLMNRIPRLCMTCELRQGPSEKTELVAWNGLVVLEVHELADAEACEKVKHMAMQQPSTWAAMVGADEKCVIIVVRVEEEAGERPTTEEEAERLNRAAYQRLIPIYDALLGQTVARMEPNVKRTILMPFDPAPRLNPGAVPFRVEENAVKANTETMLHLLAAPEQPRTYEETEMDTYMRHARLYTQAVSEARRRMDKIEAQAAATGSDANPGTGSPRWWENFITKVAQQLCDYGLAEGETAFQIWHRLTYKDEPILTEECVRTLVAAVYALDQAKRRPKTEPPITSLMHTLIRRISTHYVLRRNLVMGYAEYRPNNSWVVPWQPVTEEVINTFATDLQLSGLEVWERDVRRYVYSNRVPTYDPVEEFLLSVNGKWDGHDHIRDLAMTVPTDIPEKWARWFHIWFLGMVQQWRDRRMQFGNSAVPLLISGQGMHKSTFCRNLLPRELRQWGYADNLSLAEERPIYQAMAQMLLINLDEFNRISPKQQQGLLKNILQLPSVKVKRPYGRHVEEMPRLASFIATTNLPDVLTDPSGSRRFIGVNVTGSIDVSHEPNYVQLYAQAVAELHENERYWFDKEDTADIMAHNRQFQQLPSAFQFLNSYFEPAPERDGQWYTAAELLAEVKRCAGSALRDIPSVNAFGRYLNAMDYLPCKHTRFGNVYRLRKLPMKKRRANLS